MIKAESSISSHITPTMSSSSSSHALPWVCGISDLEKLSIPELMTYVKSEFRSLYFKEVENVVVAKVERLELHKEEELRNYRDKVGKLEFTIVDLEAEVNDYKLKCEALKEEVFRLEEDCRIGGERETRASERISRLLSELLNANALQREVLEQKAKNEELKCLRKRAEDELEAYKKKHVELETRVTKLEEDTASLVKDDLDFEVGAGGSPKQSKVQGKSNGGWSNLKIKGTTENGIERVLNSSKVDSVCHASIKGSGSEQLEGSPVNLMCKPVANHKEEIKAPSSVKLGIGRSDFQNVIEIIDDDNEAISKEDLPNNILLRTFSSERSGDGSRHGEKHPSVSAQRYKRRRLILEDDSEADDDEHTVKNRNSRGSEVHHHSDSLGDQSCVSPTVSYRGENRQETEKTPKCFNMDRTPRKSSRNLIAENVVQMIGSDGAGKSLGVFDVIVSDDSDKEANAFESEKTNDSASKLVSSIRRRRTKGFNWKYEFDMLSSFEVDSVLCMRAVCALYRQHVFEGKATKVSLHLNDRGVREFDEKRGTAIAKFLLEGNQEGEIKKSVKDLEMHHPNGLNDCRRLAKNYSKQLFTMYKNKEDPFFP